MNQYQMQDPRTQYPKPKFNAPSQPEPGDIHKMDPEPDHGETSYKGSGRLKGRKALITGGDSGIGRANAIAYAREGADVVINYLPSEEQNAQEVIKLIEAEGRKAVALPGDVSDESFCNELVDKAHEALGGLDIVVSNAGKQLSVEDIQEITTEQFDATFKTNVYAPFWIIKRAVPKMKPGSAIIVTSSIQAYEPSPNLVDYASTKAAEKAMVQALGPQLIEKGIRINAVAPGPIWTPLQPSGGQPIEKVQTFGEQVPLKRPGQPAELAPVFVFLASQESSYVIGETYGVTGGAPTA